MSQADELLASLTDEEIAAYSADTGTEPHIVVDENRYITVPDALKRIAVQYDHNVETVTFDCIRYWDGHDLSTMHVYVNYEPPGGMTARYLCEDVTVDETDDSIMHFTWQISSNVTSTAGNIRISVCVKDTNSEGEEITHWNSEPNTDMYVSPGLACPNDDLDNANPDIVEQLLARMDAAEEAVYVADIEGAIDYYNETKAFVTETQESIEANNDALHTRIVDDAADYYNETKAFVTETQQAIENDKDVMCARFDEFIASANDLIQNECETYELENKSNRYAIDGDIISNGIDAILNVRNLSFVLPYATIRATGIETSEDDSYAYDYESAFWTPGAYTVTVTNHDSTPLTSNIHVKITTIANGRPVVDSDFTSDSDSYTFELYESDGDEFHITVSKAGYNFDVDVGIAQISGSGSVKMATIPDEVVPMSVSQIDITGANDVRAALRIGDGTSGNEITFVYDFKEDGPRGYTFTATDTVKALYFPYAVKDANISKAELNDLRVDIDGVRHASAGAAVRYQIEELKEEIVGLVRVSVSDESLVFTKGASVTNGTLILAMA